MKSNWQKIAQQGSMMVEALAMLGLITMVTPILYKKAAERTTELQDINTATQMRTLSKALDDYVQDNYNEIAEGPEGKVAVSKNNVIPYLPYNFNIDESKLFTDFKFAVRNELINKGSEKEHSAITGVVLAPTSDKLPMLRAAKIASMVGANGGVVLSNAIQGVQGGWQAPLGDFGLGNAPDGSLVTSSVHAVTSAGGGGGDSKHVLYRDDSKGMDYNTMQTTLYMGGNDIEEVVKLKPLNDVIEMEGNVKTKNLDVAGYAHISQDVTAQSGKITNLLEAGTATIAGLITGKGGATITGGNTSITGGTIGLTGTTNITGDTTINTNVKVGADGVLQAQKGAVVSGVATGKTDAENTTYSLISEGNMLVQANAHVMGSVKIDTDLIAKNLYGETSIGGGKMADGKYNFVANKDGVTVAGNNFKVGHQIQSDASGVYLNDFEGTAGLTLLGAEAKMASKAGSVALQSMDSGGTVYSQALLQNKGVWLTGPNVQATAGNMQLAMKQNQATLGVGSTSGWVTTFPGPKIDLSPSGAVLTGGKSSGIRTPYVDLTAGDVKVEADIFRVTSDNVYIDNDDIVFDSKAVDPISNDKRTSGVRINRQGMIDMGRAVAPAGGDTSAGRANTPGYVRADRLLANAPYKKDIGTGGYVAHPKADGNDAGDNAYDAYQVNPAYTSVMHDIKLTTRGGARLSDVLPDFINKGIYVLDNTYKEEKGKEQWEKYTVHVGNSVTIGGGPGDCTSSECIASPWLGFVPTPQCPPGYSKVITISPIRWKMSEAYFVAGSEPTAGDAAARFKAYFLPLTDPSKASFELESVPGIASHIHKVTKGWPLTFQTNTWLNTTVSGVKGDGGTADGSGSIGPSRNQTFVGWHAIMGFLYYANDYQEYLTKLGQTLKDVVVWNLFPVYNEEMTAIANVYCYFERRSMTSDPRWEWDSEIVDTGYDQLTNFRFGFQKKNSGYNTRLNDPQLLYNEVW